MCTLSTIYANYLIILQGMLEKPDCGQAHTYGYIFTYTTKQVPCGVATDPPKEFP